FNTSLDLSRNQAPISNHAGSLPEIRALSISSAMTSTMVINDANARPMPKPGSTSFFIRDLLMKDVYKSPKKSNSANNSDDESGHERPHHSLARLSHLYQSGRLPNGLNNYFDRCL